MNGITNELVKERIGFFLDKKAGLIKIRDQCEKKKVELKQVLISGHENKKQKIEQEIEKIKQQLEAAYESRKNKYSLDEWMEKAATTMVGQLKFGTHISRGIHPKSQGDNIDFTNYQSSIALPEGIIGSQFCKVLELDASGNAAALPLAELFKIIIDDKANVLLKDLILKDHNSLDGVFACNNKISQEYQLQFKACLVGELNDGSKSDTLNKQLLWPLTVKAIEENKYICLIPLYPSSLTHNVHNWIQNKLYSDDNNKARTNRRKKDVEQQSYFTLPNLAVTQLGGKNPQNVSRLVALRRGAGYLLPSLPPILSNKNYKSLKIHENMTTIFNKNLKYICRDGFKDLYQVIESPRNNEKFRNLRKEALDKIIDQIFFAVGQYIYDYELKPGWSADYPDLDLVQQYWLDPYRVDCDLEFKRQMARLDWVWSICDSFAQWVNSVIMKKFTEKTHAIGDAEYEEWCEEMRQAIKLILRQGEEPLLELKND